MNVLMKIYNKSCFLQWLFRESFLNSFFHKMVQYYRYFFYKWQARIQQKEQEYRKNGGIDERFIRLKEFHGKYSGKRCFITCTGPSLTIRDLESLNNEYVFGMNSICLIHDKTDWKPDFFGIQDDHVYDKVADTLLKTDNGVVFAPYDFFVSKGTPQDWIYFPFSGAYHAYDRYYRGKFWSWFSDDCYATVYGGFTITYSLMQLAVYMGFDEIYLIGADCSYLGQKQHFIDHGHVTSTQSNLTATDRLVASYTAAKQYCDNHNVKIINVTRGGCLEVFPRLGLEEVLRNNEKNKIND